jgi:hypothetical protein
VREEEQQGHAPAQPGPAALQGLARARHDESRGEAEAEEERTQLVLETDAQDRPEHEPERRAPAVEEAHQHVHGAEPEDDVEGVHREDVADGEVQGGDERAEGREELAVTAGTQAACEELGEQHDRRTGEGGEETDAEDRVAEQEPGAAQEERAERRVVDVPPVQVLAARDVVQLVAVQPVATDGSHCEADQRKHSSWRPSRSRPGTERRRPGWSRRSGGPRC